jgi:F0F1-type ATP synthase assembly protein I
VIVLVFRADESEHESQNRACVAAEIFKKLLTVVLLFLRFAVLAEEK